ncbi:hypothetical protein AB4156_41535, partial [Cupriavidus sp. 2MCAB6]|uniref:hypothetical protein n=1 Tax=Cupriavidus sp. 2MCAB6 TaxID=3232981 RepID=UPI003F8E83AB
SQHNYRAAKQAGQGLRGWQGWLAARKARRTEVKKPVDETLIALHNLVSLLQQTQRRGEQSEPRPVL